MSDRPNIVLIMADQMAHDVIGALGHSAVKTPNLDRLAENGAVFTNCYCNSPLCAPSRASMVTGRHIRNIHTYDNGNEFPSDMPTLMHHLRLAGYDTVLSGKMHFIGADQLHGFEQRLTTDIYPSSMDWTPDWTKGAYPNPGTGVSRLKNAGVCSWNGQLDYDEEVVFRAKEYIRYYGRDEAKKKKPFFFCFSFTHPHCPFNITKEYWDMYSSTSIPLPKVPAEDMNMMHPYNQWIQIHHEADACTLTEEETINSRRAYYGMVSYFDNLIGQIIGELERARLLDNTIIIVTSDHGEMLGEHGMWFKRTFYDPAAKVPLIISWPGVIEKGMNINKTVSLVDLTATLLEMANIHDYRAWIGEMDGDSFCPLLFGNTDDWKDEALCEYYGEGTIHLMAALRRSRYKYVHVHGYAPLLFDMEADPDETVDLAKNDGYQAIAADMNRRLLEYVDFDEIEKRVLLSQKNRLMISEALNRGKKTPWDFQPFFDAASMYARD